MARAFTTTQNYTGLPPMERLLILKIGTTAGVDFVDVEYLLGTSWVLAERFTTSGVKVCLFGSSDFRIVPNGSASFNLG